MQKILTPDRVGIPDDSFTVKNITLLMVRCWRSLAAQALRQCRFVKQSPEGPHSIRREPMPRKRALPSIAS